MNIQIIADVIESIYYNGRPKSDAKMDVRDFRQLAQMAHGNIMRQLFEQQQKRSRNNSALYFGQHIDRKVYKVGKPDRKGRRYVELENKDNYLRLPEGAGVFAVMPVGDCDCDDFRKATAGQEWLLCGPDFDDMQWFALIGDKIELHGAPECLKEVEVVGITSDEEVDIPKDVAFDIVNMVCGLVLKVAGFPIDKTINQNPAATDIEKRLSNAPQS